LPRRGIAVFGVFVVVVVVACAAFVFLSHNISPFKLKDEIIINRKHGNIHYTVIRLKISIKTKEYTQLPASAVNPPPHSAEL